VAMKLNKREQCASGLAALGPPRFGAPHRPV
jgi:hypothetical protein